uniref:Uncharacterized protein n=1 Tax=Picea glauca TaxID=3330 RepID=A0A117NFE9_PICGL|nr:hypothetical protein ABT39_MTgene4042 [Picea glauca]
MGLSYVRHVALSRPHISALRDRRIWPLYLCHVAFLRPYDRTVRSIPRGIFMTVRSLPRGYVLRVGSGCPISATWLRTARRIWPSNFRHVAQLSTSDLAVQLPPRGSIRHVGSGHPISATWLY